MRLFGDNKTWRVVALWVNPEPCLVVTSTGLVLVIHPAISLVT